MTIDWVLVLAPLAVLPVVLLLVFVGCSLDPYGDVASLPIALLFLDPADFIDMVSLKVHLQYTLETGQSPPNLRGSTNLTGVGLGAFVISGGFIDLSGVVNLLGQPDGMLDCICTVTFSGSVFNVSTEVEAWVVMSPGNGDGASFTLSRVGNVLDLVGETGHVAFEGG
jgi:hypothetical protein